jgi:hypothetical protein
MLIETLSKRVFLDPVTMIPDPVDYPKMTTTLKDIAMQKFANILLQKL